MGEEERRHYREERQRLYRSRGFREERIQETLRGKRGLAVAIPIKRAQKGRIGDNTEGGSKGWGEERRGEGRKGREN